MDLKQLFRKHPETVGETYVEHLRAAFGFGLPMLGAGLACLVHGLLPFLFTRTGSRTITRLHERMVVNRRRVLTAAEDSAGSSLTLSATMEAFQTRNIS